MRNTLTIIIIMLLCTNTFSQVQKNDGGREVEGRERENNEREPIGKEPRESNTEQTYGTLTGSGSGSGGNNRFSSMNAIFEFRHKLKSTVDTYLSDELFEEANDYDDTEYFNDIEPESLNDSYNGFEFCGVKPKTLDELTDGYTVFFSAGKTVADASGNLIFISVKDEKEISQLIYKFLQVRKDECENNGEMLVYTWGVGVDLKLTIKSKTRSAKLTSLSNIAAAVTYQHAEVQYELNIIGITGNVIRNNINLNGDFTVENYANIKSNIDSIIDNMARNGVKITPQLIAVE